MPDAIQAGPPSPPPAAPPQTEVVQARLNLAPRPKKVQDRRKEPPPFLLPPPAAAVPLQEHSRQPVQLPHTPAQRCGGLGGVGGGGVEELPAGAKVAHGAERAEARGADGGRVVLVGGDGEIGVADLRETPK